MNMSPNIIPGSASMSTNNNDIETDISEKQACRRMNESTRKLIFDEGFRNEEAIDYENIGNLFSFIHSYPFQYQFYHLILNINILLQNIHTPQLTIPITRIVFLTMVIYFIQCFKLYSVCIFESF